MSSEKIEWVEIIEPRTKEHMYANLTTGECVWDPPPGVHVKKTDNNQWWELFDQCTSRFYYYNATSQKTMWHRPSDCDIIPLAKLQTLKQNTEPDNGPTNTNTSGSGSQANSLRSNESKKRETVSTATQTPTGATCKQFSPVQSIDVQTSPTSPSPSARRHHHHHHHHHHNNRHHRHNNEQGNGSGSGGNGGGNGGPRRQHNHSQDSGRSSDSSVSHSRTSLESGSFRLLDSPHRHHHRSPGGPPLPSANIPPPPPQRNFSGGSSGGNSMESVRNQQKGGSLDGGSVTRSPKSDHPSPVGLSLSTSTPVFKKKTFANDSQRDSPRDSRENRDPRQSPGCLDLERTRNGKRESNKKFFGREKARNSCGVDTTTSPYRESPVGFRPEVPPYRSPEVNSSYKAASEKFKALLENERREREMQRERINSLEKSSQQFHQARVKAQEGSGSVGRRQPPPHGLPAPLSESNIREKYGPNERVESPRSVAKNTGVVSNVAKQRSLDVLDKDRGSDKEKDSKDFRRQATTCNSSNDSFLDPKEAMARSFNLAQQQRLQQQLQKHQVSGGRRREKEDETMQEQNYRGTHRGQDHDHTSNSCSSNSSNGSSDSVGGEETEDPGQDETGGKKKRSNGNSSPPSSPFYGNLDADHLLPFQHYILQQAKLSGCYKFGDPLLAEEGEDSLDEEAGRGAEIRSRPDDDSDDQFADDEAASNQGDSSSQEYLEDHYADLGNYDTAGLATYYNTGDTLTRPHATPPVPPTLSLISHHQTHMAESHQHHPRENPVLPPPRPVSLPAPTVRSTVPIASSFDATDFDETRRDDPSGDIEKYAQDNLNLNCGRPKGLRILWRKKCSVRDILSWSKDPIPQPMLAIVDGEKMLKREACNLFRLVQVYMGDRKANVGMTLDGVAMDVVNTAYSKTPLRDELYVQICRQTTENPRKESLRRGWELMAICLAFVPPTATFEPYLEGYMNRHRDPNFQFPEVAKWPIHVQVSHYATVACRRLQRIGAHGKKQPRKATVEDIDQARIQIFRASMFGGTLNEVMALQRDRFPQRELPWIQTTLTRQVLIRGGTMTEGIFRVSADADEVNVLKNRLDKFEDGAILAASQDAHAPASLLKLWIRELYEPLIPDSMYAECVNLRYEDPVKAAGNVAAVVERLPEINRRVLCHFVHFLQIFSRPDVVARTKMDASNLAMVMAPNILRCMSQDPRVILENARKEMAFVRCMIETLETAWVEDLH